MNPPKQKYGSPVGLLVTLAMGYALYFLLLAAPRMNVLPSYDSVISKIDTVSSQMEWFFINFSEADFYAGFLTSVFLIAGAAAAWQLAVRKTRFAGFEICYGHAHLWPWVFASQLLSLLLSEYLFGYLHLFDLGIRWIPTFIVLVGVPPSMVMMYGPGMKTLLTASVIGAAVCTPAAYWISLAITDLSIPGAVSNVLAMAVTGAVAGCTCRALPWMKKTEVKPTGNTNSRLIDYSSVSWILRRTVADLTEPQFYGSDIASLFLLAGVCIEWILGPSLLCGGKEVLPAVILSQFISGSVGVFLYTGKYREKGWYPTYIPVVCTAPACILTYGTSMSTILVAGILGGVIGAPVAEWLNDRKPDFIHETVGNVTAMAISTVMVAAVLKCLTRS
jgi:hypothetical protein